MGRGAEDPLDFKLMNVTIVQAVTAKELMYEKQERKKKKLSGYKQCYTYKNQSLDI